MEILLQIFITGFIIVVVLGLVIGAIDKTIRFLKEYGATILTIGGIGTVVVFPHTLYYIIGFLILVFIANFYLSKKEVETENKEVISVYGSCLALMGKIAKVDGVISEEEAGFITERITDLVEQDEFTNRPKEVLRKELIDYFNISKNDNKDTSNYTKNLISMSSEFKEDLYSTLLFLSLYDGLLLEQIKIIQKIGFELGFSKEEIYNAINIFKNLNTNEENHQYSNNKNELEGAYSLLGCTSSDSDNIIKKKYKEMVRKFHPDFIMGKDLDDEFTRFATTKLQEINNAYDLIKKSRGI